MTQYRGRSKVTDYEMREAVKKLPDEEREAITQAIWVSHTCFQNWMDGKDKMGNSKTRHRLKVALGM